MAGAKGLEPSTFAVTGRRCNQLNYAPAVKDSELSLRYSEETTILTGDQSQPSFPSKGNFLCEYSSVRTVCIKFRT
jgi:hypothetical protein